MPTATEAKRKPPVRLDISAALEPFPNNYIADRLGVSIRTVERIVANGVGYWEADIIAAKVLGSHAEFEWGAAWRDLDEFDRPAFRITTKSPAPKKKKKK